VRPVLSQDALANSGPAPLASRASLVSGLLRTPKMLPYSTVTWTTIPSTITSGLPRHLERLVYHDLNSKETKNEELVMLHDSLPALGSAMQLSLTGVVRPVLLSIQLHADSLTGPPAAGKLTMLKAAIK
jgi:hypothetical protein